MWQQTQRAAEEHHRESTDIKIVYFLEILEFEKSYFSPNLRENSRESMCIYSAVCTLPDKNKG